MGADLSYPLPLKYLCLEGTIYLSTQAIDPLSEIGHQCRGRAPSLSRLEPPSTDQPEQHTLGVEMAAKLDKILKTVADAWQDLCKRVDVVTVEMGLLHDDYKKLSSCVTQMEHTLDELRPAVSELGGQVISLAIKVPDLRSRAEDFDGQYHHNNLCILGFPGGVEDFLWDVTGTSDCAHEAISSLSRGVRSLSPHTSANTRTTSQTSGGSTYELDRPRSYSVRGLYRNTNNI
ncbi:hypothetical protein NDU88_002292 [Pleurodeles waltl]|uniref:Uncharacterized protein n=1 Tax=Pleurodeles waltl TaxID=8319 RepID=A0AAV7ND74_PLEWA|nr:hypothetical protein NDU88_002292 [Pleurodeles waltl]